MLQGVEIGLLAVAYLIPQGIMGCQSIIHAVDKRNVYKVINCTIKRQPAIFRGNQHQKDLVFNISQFSTLSLRIQRIYSVPFGNFIENFFLFFIKRLAIRRILYY